MAVNNPNLQPTRVPLSRLLILGVMQRLSEVFSVPSERIIPISTSDRMRVAQKAAERAGKGEIVFPQILLYITSFVRGDVENSGYNPRVLARQGQYTKLDDNQGAVQRLHLFPVTIEMEVIYQTNDYFGGLNYGSLWMSAGLRRKLNFTLTYMNVPLDIAVDLGGTLAVPELDASIDTSNYFEYDSGIRVNGYLEDTEIDDGDRVSMLRQQVTNFNLVDDVKAPTEPAAEYSSLR